AKKGAAYLILIDPDITDKIDLEKFVSQAVQAGVDGFLIGGSLLISGDLDSTIKRIKEKTDIPVIIFPGGVEQISPFADAILFISLISGRNADQIFGKHVLAAPRIKKMKLEAISCGYMLIESGKPTTAQYISGSNPIPRNKPEIAAATAMAAEMMGMKSVYLEAGSGAEFSVPEEMIAAVAQSVDIPVIVGGGIRTPEDAAKKVKAGAKIVVTGNYFESEENWNLLNEFSSAIHSQS
ncbi:MAG: geranylgeranylglyceryl/heptaprenylglyceryl phosphate synthase, partial [Ignavibacteria bacterium]